MFLEPSFRAAFGQNLNPGCLTAEGRAGRFLRGSLSSSLAGRWADRGDRGNGQNLSVAAVRGRGLLEW